ncbi:hypothetical protein FOA52_004832 [Chlamydomonas sp. UWO 241]|nr:hypothetical protein FOA52_004832 [Chlamydomonas sp. UWO 241]
MNRLTRENKNRLQQFLAITGASEKVATECLRATQWSVEHAIDHYYASGLAAVPGASSNIKSLDGLFDKYKESDGDMIQAEGLVRFCEDLGVDPSDVVVLIISYYMSAAVMCEYSKQEFTTGMLKMGVDSVEKLKKKLPELRMELKSEDRFRDVYNYAYMFSREKNQKCVQFDVALAMWRILLEGQWPLLDDWCNFLTKHHSTRAVSRDTWQQLLDFIKTIKPDFSNFDDTAAWPYLLDEFVSEVKGTKETKA